MHNIYILISFLIDFCFFLRLVSYRLFAKRDATLVIYTVRRYLRTAKISVGTSTSNSRLQFSLLVC